jgi:DNA repair exonuclease SbcCD nuclease subunit
LFDSAYPPIETLKQTFYEFKRLKDKDIPVFLIAGSHDYSVSGKTFLDVLEKAGLCKNVFVSEEKDGKIYLLPTVYKNVAIYGFPGKKSGLEVEEIEKITIQDSPGLFKILMLHTAIRDAAPNPLIKSVNQEDLPKVDYLALGHLHIKYNKDRRVYPGPTFPNNILELEELQAGYFCIFDSGEITRREIKLKDVVSIHLKISNALDATDLIINEIEKRDVEDKIVVIRLYGIVQHGKVSDIDFNKVDKFLKEKKAFVSLRNTSKLHSSESEMKIDSQNTENLENQIITQYLESNPNKFNDLIPTLLRSLNIEKLEDEKSNVFQERILSEAKKSISI